ncbi:MAG: bifunctional UDP-N-acetylmuramoyl-tripeptide:D-alanyl-D-alanine ligase/alanine racemase [Bacteroidales bacterium]|jgi:alanine racemase|nr:bifunctional UDP-N-acetylmuramoyl-tripeptide:D-alanyl-D-alanine ligase/alanine racemase [Bacteroidales bacterium]
MYTISKIASVVAGSIISNTDIDPKISDILIDSRKLISPKGTIFIALKTRKNDGHKYISSLYQRGLRYFLVSTLPVDTENLTKAHFIVVDDTLAALQQLVSNKRKNFNIPIIGISGSNGKTIIKEWLFQMLQPDKEIIRSPKSYNSQIGVPLSVWQIKSQHELAIFEAGISEPDEMQKLQTIIQPTLGIFTNIGQAHDENFINTNQKIGEKLKLFTKVDTLIYNLDHSEIQGIIIRSQILESVKPFTWSNKQVADLQITKAEKIENGIHLIALFKEGEIDIQIPFIDAASIENSCHVWATMLHLGYDNDVIKERMLKLNPVAMRLELKEGINNCSIINDSYNSDISSLVIALDFLNQQNQHNKKTLILSDILQSGKSDLDLYQEIALLLENKNIDRLIGIGPAISRMHDQFNLDVQFFLSTEEFLNKFSFTNFQNESILLKGARFFEFEQISKVLQQKSHQTVLEINLDAMISNLNYFRLKLKPETNMMIMVKAFSYGSGSYEIANIMQYFRADYLAVAYADEGVELRKSGINLPIMVMSPDDQSFDSILKYNLEPEIYSFTILNKLEEAIKKNILPKNKPVKIHLKIDTGMHRLGFEPDNIDELIKRLNANKQIYPTSIFTHLAASGDPRFDDFTHQQVTSLNEASEKIQSHCDHSLIKHVLNSSGISRFPDYHLDMVRLGIGLYGLSPNPLEEKNLQNIGSLKTSITQIKHLKIGESVGYNRAYVCKEDKTIGIIPIGYADGLNRLLGNEKSQVIVNDTKVSIIGDICMDMCMIDLSETTAQEGDDVIIFSNQQHIKELANVAQTIPYEILTGISRRVKRVYFRE